MRINLIIVGQVSKEEVGDAVVEEPPALLEASTCEHIEP
jgi:hypothetical protein